MVSQIFGLGVSLVTAGGKTAVSATYADAPFTDIYAPNGSASSPPYNPWLRIPAKQFDEVACAVYQSQLVAPAWDAQVVSNVNSTFLSALLTAAGGNPLSIRFNVDAMVMESNDPNFPTGRLVGTIGVAQPGEPQHLARGRQIFSLGLNNAPPPMQPPLANPFVQYNYAVALVDPVAGKLIVDLGNALPSNVANPANPASDTFIDAGRVSVGYVTESGFAVLDDVPYTGAGWYQQTAAVVDLPAGRELTPAELDAISTSQLQLVTYDSNGNAIPQGQEAWDGTYVRADDFVLRMSPGDIATVTLYATRFGQPLPGATISLALDDTCMLTQQTASNLGKGPSVGTPPSALTFPQTVVTDVDGMAQIAIAASDPGTPRRFSDGGFIDGQVYGIRPLLAGTGSAVATNPSDFISVLVWSGYTAPAEPTWSNDVHPILVQYANLYPVMKPIVDLSSYAHVVAKAASISDCLTRGFDDPQYMPVTRDLSPAKTAMILAWFATTGGPGGGPNS
jgi:hypothetical protein